MCINQTKVGRPKVAHINKLESPQLTNIQLYKLSPSLQAVTDGGYLFMRNQWAQKLPAMQLPPESHGCDPEHIALPTFTATLRDQAATNSK